MNNVKKNERKSIKEDLDRMKQKKEERKINRENRENNYFKNDEYINLIKKKKQNIKCNIEKVMLFLNLV